MLQKSKFLPTLVAALFLASAGSLQAGLDPKADDTVKSVLARQVGQTVELRLKNGEKIAGKVELVGKDLVQLTQLTGAEFYESALLLPAVPPSLLPPPPPET